MQRNGENHLKYPTTKVLFSSFFLIVAWSEKSPKSGRKRTKVKSTTQHQFRLGALNISRFHFICSIKWLVGWPVPFLNILLKTKLQMFCYVRLHLYEHLYSAQGTYDTFHFYGPLSIFLYGIHGLYFPSFNCRQSDQLLVMGTLPSTPYLAPFLSINRQARSL